MEDKEGTSRLSTGKVWPSVGMECVCIAQDDQNDCLDEAFIPYGTICTISAIIYEGLQFKGWSENYYWETDDFRPLVTKTLEQDVAAFNLIASQAGESITGLAAFGGEETRLDVVLDALNLAWASYGVEE